MDLSQFETLRAGDRVSHPATGPLTITRVETWQGKVFAIECGARRMKIDDRDREALILLRRKEDPS